jgi:multiple sugar transport system permease protein
LLVVVALALALHPPSMRGGATYRMAVFLPVVIPEAAFAIAWLWILNPVYGPMNALLSAIGLGPVAWLTDRGAAQGAMVLISLFTIGEAFVVLLAALALVSGGERLRVRRRPD